MSAYTLAALKKLSKEDMSVIIMDLQDRVDKGLTKLYQEVQELNAKLEKQEGELAVSKLVNSKLIARLNAVEKQAYSNEQYSRKECLELSGLHNTISDENLESTVLKVFSKINVNISPVNVQACHRLSSRGNGPKKVIIKLSRRKEVMEVLANKSNLKNVGLEDSLED